MIDLIQNHRNYLEIAGIAILAIEQILPKLNKVKANSSFELIADLVRFLAKRK